MQNPFQKALENFKPVAKGPEETSEPSKVSKTNVPKITTEIRKASVEKPKPTEEVVGPKIWRHPETRLDREDQEAFELLCKIVGLTKGGRNSKRYWRVRDCFLGSHHEDCSFEINKWLGSEINPNTSSNIPFEELTKVFERARRVKEIVEPLLRRGHEARAVKWLLSRTPEGMKYGNGTREFRLEEAKKSAEKAGKTIEQIAAEHGLEDLLN